MFDSTKVNSIFDARVPTGRARLRNPIVSERHNVSVPVRHEELHVEREPITE